ncbi:MAG: polysaccharide biosynthesis C-terminal domain-containing protein, partial [Cyclobacteriaceae bacterium]|nr:polysaccharide biosynthesis C-terminal domain-containing protein [Cyclobacteriaceae bacterium]
TKLMSIVAFVNVVFMFGMETAFFRFSTKPGADTKRVFNLAQTSVLTISVTLSVLFITFASPIAHALGFGDHPEFIVWLTLVMLIDAAVAVPFARLRLQKKALLFASAKIFNVLLLIGLNFYFLKYAYDPSVGIGYVFLANLIANSFFLGAFASTLFKWRPVWDNSISPEMLRYAYPVMLTGVAGTTNEMFSRITLDWWLPENFYGIQSNAAALGVFAACYKFAVFMNLGIQAFRYAAEPFFFSHASNKNSPALFAKVNHYFTLVGCFVLVAISINLDVLQFFIGVQFREGLHIVPILLLANLCIGIYYNISIWFKLTDKTYFGTLITLGGAFITIAGNYLLIPLFGYEGSSWVAFLCYGSMTVACYVLGQKYFPVPYRVVEIIGYMLFSFLLIWLSSLFTPVGLWPAITFHTFILILFVAVAWWRERSYWHTSVD